LAILKDVSDAWKKTDKGKLILIVGMVGVGLYLYLALNERIFQKSITDTLNGFSQQQPIDLCITEATAYQYVFPPKYGVEVRYTPCDRSAFMK
jgi:hypothetical protein